jgi:hypothetical protein
VPTFLLQTALRATIFNLDISLFQTPRSLCVKLVVLVVPFSSQAICLVVSSIPSSSIARVPQVHHSHYHHHHHERSHQSSFSAHSPCSVPTLALYGILPLELLLVQSSSRLKHLLDSQLFLSSVNQPALPSPANPTKRTRTLLPHIELSIARPNVSVDKNF